MFAALVGSDVRSGARVGHFLMSNLSILHVIHLSPRTLGAKAVPDGVGSLITSLLCCFNLAFWGKRILLGPKIALLSSLRLLLVF